VASLPGQLIGQAIRIAQIGTVQIRYREVRVSKMGSPKVSTAEIGFH